jgi:XisI protein
MDRLATYRKLVKQALNEYAELLKSPPAPPYEIALAFDDEHQQYILREVGWAKDKWVRTTVLHLALRSDKIWIQEDWTEEGIASWLLRHGVPKADIMLGFQPPESQKVAELAL